MEGGGGEAVYETLGHAQRDPEGRGLATNLYHELTKKGYSAWLDVKMGDKSEAAMKEGVLGSKCVVMIVTDGSGTSEHHYFRRRYCLEEIRWALEARKQIQPVVRIEDKPCIAALLEVAPPQIAAGISSIDWIDINRSDEEYLQLGLKKLTRTIHGQTLGPTARAGAPSHVNGASYPHGHGAANPNAGGRGIAQPVYKPESPYAGPIKAAASDTVNHYELCAPRGDVVPSDIFSVGWQVGTGGHFEYGLHLAEQRHGMTNETVLELHDLTHARKRFKEAAAGQRGSRTLAKVWLGRAVSSWVILGSTDGILHLPSENGLELYFEDIGERFQFQTNASRADFVRRFKAKFDAAFAEREELYVEIGVVDPATRMSKTGGGKARNMTKHLNEAASVVQILRVPAGGKPGSAKWITAEAQVTIRYQESRSPRGGGEQYEPLPALEYKSVATKGERKMQSFSLKSLKITNVADTYDVKLERICAPGDRAAGGDVAAHDTLTIRIMDARRGAGLRKRSHELGHELLHSEKQEWIDLLKQGASTPPLPQADIGTSFADEHSTYKREDVPRELHNKHLQIVFSGYGEKKQSGGGKKEKRLLEIVKVVGSCGKLVCAVCAPQRGGRAGRGSIVQAGQGNNPDGEEVQHFFRYRADASSGSSGVPKNWVDIDTCTFAGTDVANLHTARNVSIDITSDGWHKQVRERERRGRRVDAEDESQSYTFTFTTCPQRQMWYNALTSRNAPMLQRMREERIMRAWLEAKPPMTEHTARIALQAFDGVSHAWGNFYVRPVEAGFVIGILSRKLEPIAGAGSATIGAVETTVVPTIRELTVHRKVLEPRSVAELPEIVQRGLSHDCDLAGHLEVSRTIYELQPFGSGRAGLCNKEQFPNKLSVIGYLRDLMNWGGVDKAFGAPQIPVRIVEPPQLAQSRNLTLQPDAKVPMMSGPPVSVPNRGPRGEPRPTNASDALPSLPTRAARPPRAAPRGTGHEAPGRRLQRGATAPPIAEALAPERSLTTDGVCTTGAADGATSGRGGGAAQGEPEALSPTLSSAMRESATRAKGADGHRGVSSADAALAWPRAADAIAWFHRHEDDLESGDYLVRPAQSTASQHEFVLHVILDTVPDARFIGDTTTHAHHQIRIFRNYRTRPATYYLENTRHSDVSLRGLLHHYKTGGAGFVVVRKSEELSPAGPEGPQACKKGLRMYRGQLGQHIAPGTSWEKLDYQNVVADGKGGVAVKAEHVPNVSVATPTQPPGAAQRAPCKPESHAASGLMGFGNVAPADEGAEQTTPRRGANPPNPPPPEVVSAWARVNGRRAKAKFDTQQRHVVAGGGQAVPAPAATAERGPGASHAPVRHAPPSTAARADAAAVAKRPAATQRVGGRPAPAPAPAPTGVALARANDAANAPRSRDLRSGTGAYENTVPDPNAAGGFRAKLSNSFAAGHGSAGGNLVVDASMPGGGAAALGADRFGGETGPVVPMESDDVYDGFDGCELDDGDPTSAAPG